MQSSLHRNLDSSIKRLNGDLNEKEILVDTHPDKQGNLAMCHRALRMNSFRAWRHHKYVHLEEVLTNFLLDSSKWTVSAINGGTKLQSTGAE
jgi:hypothetical protein